MLAEHFNLHRNTVSGIVNGKTYQRVKVPDATLANEPLEPLTPRRRPPPRQPTRDEARAIRERMQGGRS